MSDMRVEPCRAPFDEKVPSRSLHQAMWEMTALLLTSPEKRAGVIEYLRKLPRPPVIPTRTIH